MATSTSSSYKLVHEAKTEEHEPGFTRTTERPWRPGMLRQLPWSGLLALLLGLTCGIAALTIALVSDGKALDYWRADSISYSIQPTVLLAILVTLANVLLGYSFASGITVFWWSGVLTGKTLRQLHASQSRGDSLIAIFAFRPVFNAVTVASIFAILLLMDQPLFQRGVRVVPRTSKESRVMTIPISSSPIQRGATAVNPDHSNYHRPELFYPLFAEVVRQYQNRDPIRFALQGCEGRCEFDLVSTGWEVGCIEWETSYRMMVYEDSQIQDTETYTGPVKTQPAFSVNITYHPGDDNVYDAPAYHIDTSVMYKATSGSNGTMRWRNCTLTEALIKYPVEISNDTLSLKPMPSSINRTIQRIIRSAEASGQYDYPSTLGGIWRAMESQFAAQANITFVSAWTSIRTQDIATNNYLQAPSDGRLDSINYTYAWSDPTDDMISMAHELTLRAAIATTNALITTSSLDIQLDTIPNLLTQGQPEILSPNLTLVNRTVDQEVDVAMTFEETVYEAHPQWLIGAFMVIVMSCLSIIPTYWGWWRLGRPVSMSPLEIAKAFDAPLMQQADPNGTVNDHLRSIGGIRVRYGYHATVAEQPESDITERPSYPPRIGSTGSNHIVDQGSRDDVGPTRPHRPSIANEITSSTHTVGPARLCDDIELRMLQSEASQTPGAHSDDETTRRSAACYDFPESSSRTQRDSSSDQVLETGLTSSRIHTRIEMRLRLAEE